MKKSLLVFTLLFYSLGSFCINEAAAENLLKQANKAYASQDFNRASQLYDSLISLGYFSADVHYNLGNALYKQNRIAEAILHYEKSLKLDPGMDDAVYNLKLANMKTVDKIEPIPDFFIKQWWKSLLNIFHADVWASLTVLFLFSALLGFVVYLFAPVLLFKKSGFYLFICMLILTLFSWILADRQYKYLQKSTEAIVMTPTIHVNSSPTEGSTRLFVLHQGTKVDIEDSSNTWVKIRLPNGNQGWMKSDDLENI